MMKKEFENCRVVITALFTVCITSAAIPQGLQAQVLTACYVPDVGVVYRIQTEGVPDECTEPTHVEFSWNMEGPPGPQGPPGPAGSPVVFTGECSSDVVDDPRYGDGDGPESGAIITDDRFSLSDTPAVTVWIGRPEFPGTLLSDNSPYLEDGRLVILCFPGRSYVAHVLF